MQPTRDQILRATKEGDVIYGIAAGGQKKLLLVYKATGDTIYTRHVTTGAKAEFRRDGSSKRCDGGGTCRIVSVGPLPAEEYEVAIALDRKMRAARELTDLRLSKAEIQLLLTHGEFYQSRPLPDC